MGVARFQLLPGVRVFPRTEQSSAVPDRFESGPGAGSVAWRLLGANNHELGRSAAEFASTDEAEAAIEMLVSHLDDLSHGLGVTNGLGRWRWQAHLGGAPLATSSRSFQRERECRYNLGQFLAQAAVAVHAGDVNARIIAAQPGSVEAQVSHP